MNILHQCGHNGKWNLDALNDGVGDGLIISPVHEGEARVSTLAKDVRAVSVFDPQFYLPNSQKAKLNSFAFFPETIANGFSTLDYSIVSAESAKLCVAYQMRQGFSKIIIPTRFYEQMTSDFTDKQEAYTVAAFLRELSKHKLKRPIFITLAITSHMVLDTKYRTHLLNWITSFPEVSGVYLIVDCERNTKQIAVPDFILEMLVMLTELREAGLEVMLGYTNTESLLYLVAGDIDITIGAYENTRMFSLDKFIVSDEDRRAPAARIYLPGLLNWIQFSQAKQIRSASPTVWSKVYDSTSHAEPLFKATKDPAFNQSPLYRHYFECFVKQVRFLEGKSLKDRYTVLRSWIQKAISLNEEISEIPIDLEKHGRGDHLQPWLDALNSYYASFLK